MGHDRAVTARALVPLLLLLLGVAACAEDRPEHLTQQERMHRWLLVSGGVDHPPALLHCLEDASDDLLSPAERDEWLAHEPTTMTAEKVQRLPGARELADRCRSLVSDAAGDGPG